MKNGYYRYPTIGLNNTIAFTADDDLWEVPLIGGMARRLTSGLGSCTYPHYSADGKWLAFSSSEEGAREIYVVASEGGAFRRLTYLGANSIVLGWMDNGEILFRTDGLLRHL